MPQYLADLAYIPDNATSIVENTSLTPHIKLSRFTKGIDLNSISLSEKKDIVRNLLPNAEIMRHVSDDNELFRDCTLEVVEGIYRAGPEETITPNSLNDLKSKGRAVVYRVVRGGVVDLDKTFDFASWVNTYVKSFGKLYLDYDQYDPDGSLSCQVIIEMPNIPSDYECRFNREIITTFNNNIQSTKELIQITEDTLPTTTLALDNTSTVAKGYYCIGDSHAVRAASSAGAPWGSFAGETYTARNRANFEVISRLTRGSTVCISLGENDINFGATNISDVVGFVLVALNESLAAGHETSFLLLPVGNTSNEDRRKEFRTAMQAAINSTSGFINIIDLEQPEFEISRDGRHVTNSSYITALRRLE